MTSMLKAQNLTRVLPTEIPVTLVRDASLEISPGEFIAITGPSGSGKSSLLYLLGLLDKPTTGDIFIEGKSTALLDEDTVASIRLEKLGFVFQSHYLLPEFSAIENVMIPIRRLGKLDDRAAKTRAQEILADLGMSDHAHKFPKQMSGGQCQRVAVGRALANDPLLILADEPTGNLDTGSSAIVQKMLRDLTSTKKRSVIVVTHDPAFAASADRIVHIVDGKIVKK